MLQDDISLTLGRAKYLPRFSSIQSMVYRDYVWIHQSRIGSTSMITIDQIQHTFPEVRPQYLLTYALYHDILEWISPFWDIPTPIKLSLSSESQKLLDVIEHKIGLIFITASPIFAENIDSEEILDDIINKRSIESKIVSYLDKLDGFMVVIHELISWNREFLGPFHNYRKIFKDIQSWKKLWELSELLHNSGNYIDTLNERPDMQAWVISRNTTNSSLYNVDTLLQQTEDINSIIWLHPTSDSMRDNIWDSCWIDAYQSWKNISICSANFQTGKESWWWDKILTERGREPEVPAIYQVDTRLWLPLPKFIWVH